MCLIVSSHVEVEPWLAETGGAPEQVVKPSRDFFQRSMLFARHSEAVDGATILQRKDG